MKEERESIVKAKNRAKNKKENREEVKERLFLSIYGDRGVKEVTEKETLWR